MSDWKPCSECEGASINGKHCLAHLSQPEIPEVIAHLRDGGTLDARGARFDARTVREVLDDLRVDAARPLCLPFADFTGAQFIDCADFRGTDFAASACFMGARFFGDARFGDKRADQVRFLGDAAFDDARFAGEAQFSWAQFSGSAYFTRAHFARGGRFGRARFGVVAGFQDAHFSGDARFGAAVFSGDVKFGRTQFSRDAHFRDAVFAGRATIGPVLVSGTLRLDGADFEQDVDIEVTAAVLSARGTRFGGRANLHVRWAEAALDNASFLQRSRLVGAGAFQGLDDSQPRCRADTRQLEASPEPRLVSLRQANVESLTLGNVDLRACRFFGAHGLDQLRIEADCNFAEPPARLRYTRRRTLAEEHHFWHERQRARQGAERGPGELSLSVAAHGYDQTASRQSEHTWHPPECQPPGWLDPAVQVPTAPQIAALYRALRKALEDRKDEPGAADFYYGEMEMRRRSAPLAERSILWVYWLTSGYALRASRALAALMLTIALFAVPLCLWGFSSRESYGRALLFAAQSSISLLRTPTGQPHETAGGQAVEILLRLAGPLFFGLALLSIRGRVKR